LLILCDGGGSNPAGSPLFQQDLQTLANRMGMVLRVAHYPPYCSKHNPIEHRVFPHVTRACEGVVFQLVAGFFRDVICLEPASCKGLGGGPRIALEFNRFGGRYGEEPAVAAFEGVAAPVFGADIGEDGIGLRNFFWGLALSTGRSR
jgi:hypothetical protein